MTESVFITLSFPNFSCLVLQPLLNLSLLLLAVLDNLEQFLVGVGDNIFGDLGEIFLLFLLLCDFFLFLRDDIVLVCVIDDWLLFLFLRWCHS